MGTTDTDPLASLRQAIAEELSGVTIGDGSCGLVIAVSEAYELADLILPLAEAEVRKAKAEALREAAREFALSPFINYSGQHVQERLHSRADRIEAGGSDEHR